MSQKSKPESLRQSLRFGTIGTVMSKLISFARGILLGRLLDAGQLGIWSLAITSIQTAAYVLGFGYPAAMVRFTEKHRARGKLTAFIGRSWSALLTIGAVVSVVAYFSGPTWVHWIFGENAESHWAWIILLGIFCTIGLSLFRSILHGMRYFRNDAILSIVYNIGLLIAFVVFLSFLKAASGIAYAYITMTGAAALVIGVSVIHFARRSDCEWLNSANESERIEPDAVASEEESQSAMVSYSLGTWATGSLLVLWLALDRYMLVHLSPADIETTNEQLGDYFIVQRLVEPIMMVAMMVGSILVPHLSKLWDENQKLEVERLVNFSVKLVGILATLGSLLALPAIPIVLVFLLDRQPQFANEIVVPSILISTMAAQYLCLRPYLLCQKKSWSLACCWLVGLIVNCVLNIYLVPVYQVWGATLATAVGGVVANILHLIIVARSGFRLNSPLVLMVALPWSLLLPLPLTIGVVALATLAILFTNQLFSEDEKRRILGKSR